jgi:putative hemolysin
MGGAGMLAVDVAEAGEAPALPASLLQLGSIEVRLAASEADVRAAQALRYQVFFEELGARANERHHAALDFDDYDALCDHLLAIHHEPGGSSSVVGTYRLLRQTVAEANRGFYSSGEYDLDSLLRHCPAASSGAGQLLELGRSCVAREHRNAATIGLLWRGIASYLEQHKIRFMFGCASFQARIPARMPFHSPIWRTIISPRSRCSCAHGRISMCRWNGCHVVPTIQAWSRGCSRRCSRAIFGSARWLETAPSSTISSTRSTCSC